MEKKEGKEGRERKRKNERKTTTVCVSTVLTHRYRLTVRYSWRDNQYSSNTEIQTYSAKQLETAPGLRAVTSPEVLSSAASTHKAAYNHL